MYLWRMNEHDSLSLSAAIRTKALELGFDAVGFARAARLDDEVEGLSAWLDGGLYADMEWMKGHFDKRLDPTLLVEGTRSVVVVLLSYKTDVEQPLGAPLFAKYAYGDDYHDVLKHKLHLLLSAIRELVPDAEGRAFVDSAPVLERAWAARAGLGWQGKSSLLVNRHLGTFFFIGTLMLNIELEYDSPVRPSCGSCTRCIDACPTSAIVAPRIVDARRCISYHTIENRGDIPDSIKSLMGSRLFGCDACQDACPWNARVVPRHHPEFAPREAIVSYDLKQWTGVDEAQFAAIFRRSAVKRTKFAGFRRNLYAVLENVNKNDN